MNVPNGITLLRLVITAVCFVLLELADAQSPDPTLAWWAFGLFLLAAVTDFVDGYLARNLEQVTAFGRVADPFADKVLICGTLIALLRFPAVDGVLASWMVIVIVAREFLVTTVRGLAESSGIQFPADRLGKWKMIAQCVAASALLTMVAGATMWADVALWSMVLTLILTIWSGGNYLWKARTLLAS